MTRLSVDRAYFTYEAFVFTTVFTLLFMVTNIFMIEGDLRARSLGPGARAIFLLWLLAAIIALGFDRTGLF